MSPDIPRPRRARSFPIGRRKAPRWSSGSSPRARSSSARPTSTSSPPAWSACAHLTVCRATRSTADTSRAGRARARRSRSPQLFSQAVERLGGERVTIDFAPLLETARLLYEGPWVAERYVAIREFIERHPDALHPVTAQIIGGAKKHSAIDAFAAYYRLKELQRRCAPLWDEIDVLVTPTAGTIYRIAEVEADPVRLNSNLGYYTNFMNLLDLAAIAVPAGFQRDGLPFGITLVAPAFNDETLCALGDVAQRAAVKTMGATGLPLPQETKPAAADG